MAEHAHPAPDPHRFVVRTEPLTVCVRNGAELTTITFAGAALAVSASRAPLSAVGLWVVETASATLPDRMLCGAKGAAGCKRVGWPRRS